MSSSRDAASLVGLAMGLLLVVVGPVFGNVGLAASASSACSRAWRAGQAAASADGGDQDPRGHADHGRSAVESSRNTGCVTAPTNRTDDSATARPPLVRLAAREVAGGGTVGPGPTPASGGPAV